MNEKMLIEYINDCIDSGYMVTRGINMTEREVVYAQAIIDTMLDIKYHILANRFAE